jgi:hypothetical protein
VAKIDLSPGALGEDMSLLLSSVAQGDLCLQLLSASDARAQAKTLAEKCPEALVIVWQAKATQLYRSNGKTVLDKPYVQSIYEILRRKRKLLAVSIRRRKALVTVKLEFVDEALKNKSLLARTTRKGKTFFLGVLPGKPLASLSLLNITPAGSWSQELLFSSEEEAALWVCAQRGLVARVNKKRSLK